MYFVKVNINYCDDTNENINTTMKILIDFNAKLIINLCHYDKYFLANIVKSAMLIKMQRSRSREFNYRFLFIIVIVVTTATVISSLSFFYVNIYIIL